MPSREERLAKNEAISREINEGIEGSMALQKQTGDIRIVCECGSPDCERLIAITIDEYEEVRSEPRHFTVARGHVIPDVEFPVRETDRYIVVEKRFGTPAEVAEDEDPRS